MQYANVTLSNTNIFIYCIIEYCSNKMGGYKLTYFNLKVLGEPIRMLLHAADQPFEDDRIEAQNWPEKKPSMKH